MTAAAATFFEGSPILFVTIWSNSDSPSGTVMRKAIALRTTATFRLNIAVHCPSKILTYVIWTLPFTKSSNRQSNNIRGESVCFRASRWLLLLFDASYKCSGLCSNVNSFLSEGRNLLRKRSSIASAANWATDRFCDVSTQPFQTVHPVHKIYVLGENSLLHW